MSLYLSDTLTGDVDINGALLTTLLQSISSHCVGLESLDLSDNNLGIPGLCSVVENISLVLDEIVLRATYQSTSESQHIVSYEMSNFPSNNLKIIEFTSSNVSRGKRTVRAS